MHDLVDDLEQRLVVGGFAQTIRSSASCVRSGGAPASWAHSLTVNPRSTSPLPGYATSPARPGRPREDERCHHRVSQGRAPLSQNRKCERFWTLPRKTATKR